jgi:hypothetical protein
MGGKVNVGSYNPNSRDNLPLTFEEATDFVRKLWKYLDASCLAIEQDPRSSTKQTANDLLVLVDVYRTLLSHGYVPEADYHGNGEPPQYYQSRTLSEIYEFQDFSGRVDEDALVIEMVGVSPFESE